MIKRLFTSIKKFPITITDNAWNKMSDIIKKQNAKSFLFTANSGGCNGFNYQLDLLNEKKYNEFYNNHKGKHKPTVIKNNNTMVLIDPIAEMILLGTTVDYVSSDYNKNIFESKFIFKPDQNFASSCGCGVSFTPKL